MLKATHRQLLEVVAFVLNVDPDILEEGIIDKDEYISTFDNFLAKDGKRAMFIHFQPMEPSSYGTVNDYIIGPHLI